MTMDQWDRAIEHIDWHAFVAEALAEEPGGRDDEGVADELNAGAEIGGES